MAIWLSSNGGHAGGGTTHSEGPLSSLIYGERSTKRPARDRVSPIQQQLPPGFGRGVVRVPCALPRQASRPGLGIGTTPAAPTNQSGHLQRVASISSAGKAGSGGSFAPPRSERRATATLRGHHTPAGYAFRGRIYIVEIRETKSMPIFMDKNTN